VAAVLASTSVAILTETPRHREILSEVVDEVALL